MKTKGLCSICDNSTHCALTKESGVLECEEFFTSQKSACGKIVSVSKQARACACKDREEPQD